MLPKLKKTRSHAGNHQSKLEETVQNPANESEGIDPIKIQQVAQETAHAVVDPIA
jgi:hypothetical protein